MADFSKRRENPNFFADLATQKPPQPQKITSSIIESETRAQEVVTLSNKIKASTLKEVKVICAEKGMKIGFFIEKALEEAIQKYKENVQ